MEDRRPPDAERVARRFGLRVTVGEQLGLQRHGNTAWFERGPEEDPHGFCTLCLGARVGLDLRQRATPQAAGSLEWTQKLFPRAAIDVAQAVCGEELRTAPWVDGTPFAHVFTRESGKLLIAATAKVEVDAHEARRALFYGAYRLRPSKSERLLGGTLKHFTTTGGQAADVCGLFPDFDLEAAREHGVLAVPGYDRLLVFRPAEKGAIPWAALRQVVRLELREAAFPFSRRLYSLRRNRIIPAEVCGAAADHDPAHLAAKLLQVEHD